MRLPEAIVRSTVLALVCAGLTALIMLAVGSITYAVRVELGRVAPHTGFEPNYFSRTVGLPVAAIVFVMVLVGSVVRLKRG